MLTGILLSIAMVLSIPLFNFSVFEAVEDCLWPVQRADEFTGDPRGVGRGGGQGSGRGGAGGRSAGGGYVLSAPPYEPAHNATHDTIETDLSVSSVSWRSPSSTWNAAERARSARWNPGTEQCWCCPLSRKTVCQSLVRLLIVALSGVVGLAMGPMFGQVRSWFAWLAWLHGGRR